QVGVDACDHDARVDRDELDADDSDPHVRIDHEPLVENKVDDVREPARARSALQVVARGASRCDRHRPQTLPGLSAFNRMATVTSTRVRFASSLWKLITPECCVPLTDFQAMRSFLGRSVISPSHSRVLNQIFSRQWILFVSSFFTSRTRCMNFGNSSNCVHAWYALSTGTPT